MKGILARLAAATLFSGFLLAQSLTIYTEVSPPYQFLDVAGKPAGYACDLVRELQRRTRNADPIEVVPWIRGYVKLQSDPNILLFAIARTRDRDPRFHWVGPIADNRYAFYVKAGSRTTIRNLADARKLHLIGVYKEDVRDQYLTAEGFTNLDRSLDALTPFKKLLSGRIDALVTSRQSLPELCRMAGAQRQDLREAFPFLSVQMYLAFSKTTPAPTVKAWAEALEGMKRDGSFERIFRKYFRDDPLPGPPLKPTQ